MIWVKWWYCRWKEECNQINDMAGEKEYILWYDDNVENDTQE